MEILVSIIVPIYNVEKYLSRCLDALINQTYQNIEIIAINDGSSDNSLAIIKEYQEKSNKIILIDQKNGGLSDARNSGLRVAKGQYIAFVDSDDYMALDTIEKQKIALDQGFDMVEPVMELVYDDKPNQKYAYVLKNDIENYPLKNDFKHQLQIVMGVNGKMYPRGLIEDLFFPKGLIHEDVYYTSILLSRFKRVKKLEQGTFYYYMRSDSIMGSINSKIFEMFDILKLIEAYYLENHLNKQVVERIFVRNLLFFTIFQRCAYFNDDALRDIKVKEILVYFKQHYPTFLKNPYISIKEKLLVYVYMHNYYLLKKHWRKLNGQV